MAVGIQYTIRKNRYEKALSEGVEITENGFVCTPDTGIHYVILRALDSGREDCPWGRLVFNAEIKEEAVYYIYALSSNEKVVHTINGDIPIDEYLQNPEVEMMDKKAFFGRQKAVRYSNKSDVLLYSQKGRYIWIMVEILGETTMAVTDMRVQAPGDNFMRTFPLVYQHPGDFFHRYMSVFSTIYSDMQDKIDNSFELLDPDKAPKELLLKYVSWMGIDLQGGFLSEDILRTLVKEAFNLNKYKGTRRSVERICEIILGDKPLIVEQNHLQGEDKNGLYGSSPYDVTLLVSGFVDEKTRAQLTYLLEQFKPIRSILHIVYLQDTGVLDRYSYMDMNAKVFEKGKATLDKHQLMNGEVIIQ